MKIVEGAEEVCSFVSGDGRGEITPKSWLGAGNRIPLEDAVFNVPLETDKYLRNLYGDYMQPPPSEKRVTIHRRRGGALPVLLAATRMAAGTAGRWSTNRS